MAQHIAEKSQEEQRAAKRHPKSGVKPGPHQLAEFMLSATVAGVANYQIAQSFNLSEDLEAAVEIGRHSIHEASRKVRMTDEDIHAILSAQCDADRAGHHVPWEIILKDIRDRYEGLGQYAPISEQLRDMISTGLQPPAPAAEPVKG